jgi:hypothetical protein
MTQYFGLQIGKFCPAWRLTTFELVVTHIPFDEPSLRSTGLEAFVALEECLSRARLGCKDQPVFAGVIGNSDPIQMKVFF